MTAEREPPLVRMARTPEAVTTIVEVRVIERLARLACGHRVAFKGPRLHPALVGQQILCSHCERLWAST